MLLVKKPRDLESMLNYLLRVIETIPTTDTKKKYEAIRIIHNIMKRLRRGDLEVER